MAEGEASRPGTIIWRDLTVPDAEAVQRFYASVVGWRAEPFEGDFNMLAPGDAAPVAGICFARGPNANLPPVWLMYVAVADLEESLRAVQEGGGALVEGPRGSPAGRFCVIRDPAGACIALYESKK
jgi:predicted enzyme related to lactoylglutathione lyase